VTQNVAMDYLAPGHEEGPLGQQTTLAQGAAEATWGRKGSRGRRGEGRRRRGAWRGRSEQRTLQDGGGGRRRGDGWRPRELTKRRIIPYEASTLKSDLIFLLVNSGE
jgi:hypothetical protein